MKVRMSMDMSTKVRIGEKRPVIGEWFNELRSIKKMCKKTVQTQKAISENGLETRSVNCGYDEVKRLKGRKNSRLLRDTEAIC